MQKPELLAPAGDLEAGYAALYYGADAVYLGLKAFSARASATNFSPEELNEFTAYAHYLKRKVYVTINTLIQEKELTDLLATLDVCSACQVDGIILQDLGVARIIKKSYPELSLHASTQMAVHNKEGALALQKAGFSRIVLARELTLSEIKEIAQIPGLETEAFIHGALCYCYSGLCLFSSMEQGRSANRGKCAYPCRSLFKRGDTSAHFFSMKDMALQEEILKLPVTSLKIEGRKKKALYVAAVTDYYRRILDKGKADPKRAENIRQIFSRPWTKFRLHGKNTEVVDNDFVGHRGLEIGKAENIYHNTLVFTPNHPVARFDGIQIDVPGSEKPFGFSVQEMRAKNKNVFEVKAGEKVEIKLPPKAPFIEAGQTVYLASSSEVKGSYKFISPKPHEYKNRITVPVEVILKTKEIVARSGKTEARIVGDFQPAQNPEKMNDAVKSAFLKFKDTEFLPTISIKNDPPVFVPMSTLNQLRRDLYEKIEIAPKHGTLPKTDTRPLPKDIQWILKTDDLEKIKDLDTSDFNEIIIVLQEDLDLKDLKKLPKEKVRLALPTWCLNPYHLKEKANEAFKAGYTRFEIGNVWGLEALPKGAEITADASFYMMNTEAVQTAKEWGITRITLPVEDTLENLKTISKKAALPTVLTVYQDVPLFQSVNCLTRHCAVCQKKECRMRLTKNGQIYHVWTKDCQTTVFNDKPFYIGKERADTSVDFYRIDFINRPYTPKEVADIVQKVQNCENIPSINGNLKKEI
ncbi:MAG: U32 family peptidase [Alphaproteobacteria bacterium]|nr:U32 family peptidase [Alphaproteobacteria bacterium]